MRALRCTWFAAFCMFAIGLIGNRLIDNGLHWGFLVCCTVLAVAFLVMTFRVSPEGRSDESKR